MKAPTKVTLGFYPDKNTHPVFESRIGKILWTCIKNQHLTSTFFSNDVLGTAVVIEEKDPKNYKDFKKIINNSKLREFGTDCVKEYMYSCDRKLSDEFWEQVYKYITKEEELEIIVKDRKYEF